MFRKQQPYSIGNPSSSPYQSPYRYQQQRQQSRPAAHSTAISRPVSAVRPQSAMAVTSPSSHNASVSAVERPPSSLGVAWGSAYKSGTPVLKQGSTDSIDGKVSGNEKDSLEYRLKSLVNEDRSPSRLGETSWRGQQQQQELQSSYSQYSLHQRSRSYGDGATLGETYRDGYGEIGQFGQEDVYAQINRRHDLRKSFEAIPGYVPPSRTADSQQQVSLNTSGTHGNDNKAFEPEDGRVVLKESQTAGSYDLRSAWQRLYGNRAGVVMTRRQSVEDTIDNSTAESFTPSASQRQIQNTQMASHLGAQSSQKFDFSKSGPNPTHHNVMNFDPVASNVINENKTDSQHTFLHGPNVLDQRKNFDNSYLLYSSSIDPSSAGRESPTGQSSSNPDQVSGSNNSSQLSAISNTSNKLTTFKPEKKKKATGDSSLYRDPGMSLGPAAKYPEAQWSIHPTVDGQHGIVGSSARSPGIQRQSRNSPHHAHRSRHSSSSPHADLYTPHRHRSGSHSSEGTAEFVVREEGKGHYSNRPMSRGKNPEAPFIDSDEDDHLAGDYQLGPLDSVFDYPLDDGMQDQEGADSDQDGSVTPPLPPLSSMQGTSAHAISRPYSGGDPSRLRHSTSQAEAQKSDTIDFFTRDHAVANSRLDKLGTVGYNMGAEVNRGKPTRHGNAKDTRHQKTSLTDYARSRSLEDVRESGNESVISFDVENTMLMVEPSDQSEMGTLRSQAGGSSVRAQLHRLEGMYTHVIKTLEERKNSPPAGGGGGEGGRSRARRRWSIGSSDTSSMRHHHHHHHHAHREHGSGGSRHSRGGAVADSDSGRVGGKDVRAIGKRFQRLESHVITLARSVAHLSSELRSHSSMSREMENVKREIQELKKSRDGDRGGMDRYLLQAPGHFMGDNHRLLTEFERCKGWVPSLTNPRRVNKLTKFFGQEPPLLEIFMRRLGYEKYVKNFEDEHIGMIELPYMTEDRLKSIGIPMGPRLRILQEAQMCFQQGNFDIYFV
ncbi:hypothetical protein PoB_000885400 [Plakobranchus ocellatus]|uniref:SAM domain-containing protein n=1 Tax=Plakobranchus ocellatus TaxID=259542 RepID=A0AAV3YH65_9GAST|nr:hypothetical protein PoB_000885400 [Plakobranchus ocellatus]